MFSIDELTTMKIGGGEIELTVEFLLLDCDRIRRKFRNSAPHGVLRNRYVKLLLLEYFNHDVYQSCDVCVIEKFDTMNIYS